ncbi:G-protein coupled receptor [Biomphalaria glabrata]|nr:G-protein coupled receptor [Biomphalaria glabrata]
MTYMAMNETFLEVSSHSTEASGSSWFRLINVTMLSTLLNILGIVTNIINIAVFSKQGMKSTVNISFTALSVSDLINVILTEWACIGSYLLLLNSPDVIILPNEINYLTGAFPHVCVTRITAWITVYMTAERCLCIALPFKVKRLITQKRTVLAIATIYLLNILLMVPELLYYKIDWKFSTLFNTTKVGIVVNKSNSQFQGISFLLFTLALIISFILVIILTLILIFQLNKMSKWRSGSQNTDEQPRRLFLKDRVAVRTVLIVACVLIVTFFPNFVLCWLSFILPGFSINGQFSELYLDFASFVALFDAINASTSAFLYYSMNSTYRKTLREMFFLTPEKFVKSQSII